jgi:selenocysteine lyase/cysteine desulfurase
VVREFEQGLIKYKPKIAFFDSIASYPAFILPSERLVPLCKQYGAMSIVDGAHAIGQIPLNLEALDADVYFSNGYKWLCSPKGSALMRVSPRVQPLIVPATLNSADPDFASERSTVDLPPCFQTVF